MSRSKIPFDPKADPLIVRLDETSTANVLYIGKAIPTSLSSDEVWQIFRVTDTEVTFAKGNSLFDKVWDNRTSYEYK